MFVNWKGVIDKISIDCNFGVFQKKTLSFPFSFNFTVFFGKISTYIFETLMRTYKRFSFLRNSEVFIIFSIRQFDNFQLFCYLFTS